MRGVFFGKYVYGDCGKIYAAHDVGRGAHGEHYGYGKAHRREQRAVDATNAGRVDAKPNDQ